MYIPWVTHHLVFWICISRWCQFKGHFPFIGLIGQKLFGPYNHQSKENHEYSEGPTNKNVLVCRENFKFLKKENGIWFEYFWTIIIYSNLRPGSALVPSICYFHCPSTCLHSNRKPTWRSCSEETGPHCRLSRRR